MAADWLSALRMVPWSSVIESAPQLVKAAKKLFADSRANTAPAQPFTPDPSGDPVIDRLNQIETITARLGAEQKTAAELMESLVKQNERIIETVTILRSRLRMLLAICVALTGAILWLALK